MAKKNIRVRLEQSESVNRRWAAAWTRTITTNHSWILLASLFSYICFILQVVSQRSLGDILLSFVSKEFTLEAIVQVVRSLRTKSLDTNQNINLKGLPVAVTNTDLKPLHNKLQHIKRQVYGVFAYEVI